MSCGHTPGPWVVVENSWEVSTIYAPFDGTVAVCPINDLVTEESQDEFQAVMDANARLIASAPDLLEALEWISSNYENVNLNHIDFRVEAKHRADAALTKARGTS